MKYHNVRYKPLYKHDCDCCVFVKNDVDDLFFSSEKVEEGLIGCSGFIGNRAGDIYVCNNCVVIRYSDRESDNRGIYLENDYLVSTAHRLLDDVEILNAYLKFNPHSIHILHTINK